MAPEEEACCGRSKSRSPRGRAHEGEAFCGRAHEEEAFCRRVESDGEDAELKRGDLPKTKRKSPSRSSMVYAFLEPERHAEAGAEQSR